MTVRAALEPLPDTGCAIGTERKEHCETKVRLVDAERRKAEIEVALAGGTWRPASGRYAAPRVGEQWLPTRHDLRATTWARLETTMQKQVVPRSGEPLSDDAKFGEKYVSATVLRSK